MSTKIGIGGVAVEVTAQPLTSEAFSRFGDVVANPRPHVHPSAHDGSLTANAVSANQGTAIQYRDVSSIRNLYDQSPSGRSSPKMSIFRCAAREDIGIVGSGAAAAGRFAVRVMERHPFTTQTFTPVASSASRYLVIVAPSLTPTGQDEGLVVPSRGHGLPGRGLPDVRNLEAFVAESHQAVTYGAGTWHAPMVVLGGKGTALDFVVFQFASGEAEEDCQLVDFEAGPDGGIHVLIPHGKIMANL
ncbi:ureidoglycolate lyase [Geosmithia morbida]|uniref:Ureidoglycolate lyase n=1 Tax=Geosmithia morbida TaxID=1094350 RepID=A0A9P5D8Q0_9HYPO|nr:ureidoglycolate lyase [Geosmithia morbida]KAF4125749.1 ureidoglycolate lyase [Geosmithia morbida]